MENERPKRPEEEWEYVGNVWGWKVSFISLGVILLFSFLLWIRYITADPNHLPANNSAEIEKDSIEMLNKDSLINKTKNSNGH